MQTIHIFPKTLRFFFLTISNQANDVYGKIYKIAQQSMLYVDFFLIRISTYWPIQIDFCAEVI
jgi:hypothetical protein